MAVEVGFLYDKVRWEEKALINEFKSRGIKLKLINLTDTVMPISEEDPFGVDVYLQRSVSLFKGLYSTAIVEKAYGKIVVNDFSSSLICGNKLLTSLALLTAGVPQPRTVISFSEVSALTASELVGYPAVLKPIHGSWGRLVALLTDPLSGKSVIESRSFLHPIHHVYYVQEMVRRPPRDIRAFVIGDEVVAAIYRIAPKDDWRTNTGIGGRTELCKITEEIEEMSLKAARAVGGELVGVDLMESPEGLLVHEVNHVMEFRNTVPTTGVPIHKLVVDYLLRKALR